MPEQNLKDKQKKDKLEAYIEQIRQKAFELQYGTICVEFKVYDGKVENGKIIKQIENLRPF